MPERQRTFLDLNLHHSPALQLLWLFLFVQDGNLSDFHPHLDVPTECVEWWALSWFSKAVEEGLWVAK